MSVAFPELLNPRHLQHVVRLLWESSPAGVVTLDAAGRIQHANQAYATLLGRAPRSLPGLHFTDVSHPGDLERSRRLHAELQRGEVPHFSQEKRYLRPDGSVVWVHLTVVALQDEGGTFLGSVALAQDISEGRQAVEAFVEADARLEEALDASGTGTFHWDHVAGRVRLDARLARIFGLPGLETELSIDAAYERLHPEDCAPVRTAVDRAAEEGDTFAVDFRIVAPDGSLRWVHSQGRVHRDDSGRVAYVTGATTDVTARRAAEARVRFQSDLLDAVGEAVIATDGEGRVTYWNRAAEGLYGWRAEEAVGRNVLEVTPSRQSTVEAQEVLAELSSGRSWSGEFEVQRSDGTTFQAAVTNSPLRDEAGRVVGVVGVSRDVSPQKALERQFAEAQKMEAVGRLASGVAHDFNNMLSIITGTADLAMLKAPAELQGRLEQIVKAAERAGRLTQQLLAYGRRQMLEPRVFDANRRIRDLEKMLRRLIGEDVEVVLELAAGPARVRFDPVQFDQVLLNLAVNARDAMPRGGRLCIGTGFAEETGLAQAPGGGGGSATPPVVLTVSDDGSGMDEETRRRVFEPFFTTKEPGRGTGLGLSMVHGTVMQSGGEVSVASTPGEGTTIEIRLPPVVEGEGAPRPLLDPPRYRGSGRRATVLLVEDDAAVRATVRALLEEAGHRVVEAEQPAEALTRAQMLGAALDLVITDVVMPGGSGRELATRLAALRPGLRVLLVSGHTDERLAPHGLEGSRVPFLRKPFGSATLLRRVEDVLAAEPPVLGSGG